MEVGPLTRLKAAALGPVGVRWLDELPDLVAAFEREWGITAGQPFGDGSVAYVAAATTADGTAAVFKIAMPDGPATQSGFERELRALRLGQGRGCAGLLRFDGDRRAVLLERLGRPLARLDMPTDAKLAIIAATVSPFWQHDADVWRTGSEQASYLLDFVRTRWSMLDHPCSEEAIVEAETYAIARRDAFDADTAVLVHGDPHAWNVLEALDEPGRFKLVDPEPMLSHPAHDLAIPLRDWNDELVDHRDPGARVRSWCELMANATGAPADEVWEWAFIERVSSGLYLVELGDPSGALYLAVADRLADR